MTARKFNLSRRSALIGMGAAASVLPFGRLMGGPAFAQTIEGLEVIVGFAPGGGTDRSIRVIAPAWANELGLSKPVEYTYAPGAGTVIATTQLLTGRKDGTLVQGIPIPYTAWTIELEQGSYTLEDLAWIGGYFDDPDVLLVPKDSPYETIDQFIEDARREEKTVAVSAPMSASHAATVVLRELTGAKLRIVPFNGGSESRNAVAGGHVDSCMAPYWSATHVLDLVKAIGIFADKNPAPELWQPVPVNEVLDVKVPNLIEPYAMQISAEAAEQNPEVYQILVSSFAAAAQGEAVEQAAADNNDLNLFLNYRDPENCKQWVADYLALLAEFRPAMERDLDTF